MLATALPGQFGHGAMQIPGHAKITHTTEVVIFLHYTQA
jgi:hypothetical protein